MALAHLHDARMHSHFFTATIFCSGNDIDECSSFLQPQTKQLIYEKGQQSDYF